MKSLFLLTVSLVCSAVPLAAQVKFTTGSDRVVVEINKQPFTEFFIGAETTKPYLHPLRTASGKVITRVFPTDIVEGEDRDHPHERGLFIGLSDVNGSDFWANETTETTSNKGQIVLRRILDVKDGKKSGYVMVALDWIDSHGEVVLNETRTFTFYAQPENVRMFDVESRFITPSRAKFADTKDGFLGIRLGTPLAEMHGGKIHGSDGKEGSAQVLGTRGPWVDYTGTVQGEAVGVAIFDHPANPKHPAYWDAEPNGLLATNPFAARTFEKDKKLDGSVTMLRGEFLQWHWRVLIHAASAAGELPGLYQKFANIKYPGGMTIAPK